MSKKPTHNEPVAPHSSLANGPETSQAGCDLNEMAVLWMGAQSSIGAFVWASIGNYQDAEDVIQQVATEVAEHFGRYNREQPFLPWAMSIARHRVIDYYRKHAKSPIKFGSTQLDQLASAAGKQDNERSAVEYDALELCMSMLPVKTRRLFEMRYLNGMKPQSIAHRIGTTANTVSVALTRARTRLAQCVRERLSRSEATR